MRKFIVSDLHGNGIIYHSIMSYLKSINKEEDVILYINGDLIDRGIDSAEMLLNIRDFITNGDFKVIYLGGNHELLMHQTFEGRVKGISSAQNDWYDNGGNITDYKLEDMTETREQELKIVNFVSNLKIYHKFEERINNKPIVLVHASLPLTIKNECDLFIKDNNSTVFYSVWAREYDPYIPFRCRVGDEKYFTIVGHTPNNNKYGYEYHESQNYLNIDGGCARYVSGLFEYDHVPLVKVFDGYLKIITFSNNNEIVAGNYFDGKISVPLIEEELNKDRKYIDRSFKPKKLVLNSDGVIQYE